jgi:hypothetical protein
VRAYAAPRQAASAANATINRELAALKRMFSLAVHADKLTRSRDRHKTGTADESAPTAAELTA